MCGRYSCVIQNLGRWEAVFKVLLEEVDERYNIAPSAMVPVFTGNGWCRMRWGLVPAWSEEAKTKYATFNARLESFTEKPMFRSAWKENRRCLIPVSGYYEWVKKDGEKIPYYISSDLDEPLVFAGLWEKWQGEGAELLSCTIITTASAGDLSKLHHRMPVILEPYQAQAWLTESKTDAMAVLEEPSAEKIKYYKVSPEVGNPRNQGPLLVVPR